MKRKDAGKLVIGEVDSGDGAAVRGVAGDAMEIADGVGGIPGEEDGGI